MNYRNILNFNKRQFEYACDKHGLDIYNVSKDITECVLFQKTNNSRTSQDKASIFYSVEGSIEKGDILKFNGIYYIVLNVNYPENEAWRNSTLMKCNTVWNLFGETVPMVASDLSSTNPSNGSFATYVNGIVNFYTKDIPLLHKKLSINDYFYDFGGCYKLVNKFFIDGIAYLYFQRDKHSDSINYTIKNANEVTTITEPTAARFYLSYEGTDYNYYLPTAQITYTSSNESIAIVNNGNIIPISGGTVTITAICDYVFDYGNATTDAKIYTLTQDFTIDVKEPEPKETVTLDKNTISLNEGETDILVATVTPEGTTVTWSTSNNAVATVDKGLVTAITSGEAIITVSTEAGTSASCTVYVTTLDEYTVTLSTGTGYTITALTNTTVVSGGSFQFTVDISDGYRASDSFAVKANNTVLEAVNGTYTIENITENISITVEGIEEILPTPSNTVTLSCTTTNIRIGGTKKINVVLTDAKGTTIETEEIPTGTYKFITDNGEVDATDYVTVTDATTSIAYYIRLVSDSTDSSVTNYAGSTLRVTLTYTDGTSGYIDLEVTW